MEVFMTPPGRKTYEKSLFLFVCLPSLVVSAVISWLPPILCVISPFFAIMLGFMSIYKKAVRKIIYETIINNRCGALNVLSDSAFSS